MNVTESSLKKLADEFNAAFLRDKRSDGTEFCRLRNDSPQWMTDAIHKAHGNIVPDDWICEQCAKVARRMSGTDPADWNDKIGKWAEELVDSYNAGRTVWIVTNLYFGPIKYRQYQVIEQIAAALVRSIQSESEQLGAQAVLFKE